MHQISRYFDYNIKSFNMKKVIPIILCLVASISYAQDNITQTSIEAMVSRNHDQIVSLADAFSEEQFDWRPSDGVRSVAESILHVASANYFFGMKLGFEVPEGVDMMTLESSVKGKDNVIAAVNESFEFVKGNIDKIEKETFGDIVETPFGEFSKLSMLLLVLEHSGEHKGQLIAYARSNGITPPWSQ